MSRRHIEFEDKDRPLASDVSRLGALVGDMLRDQGGEALFERVEAARAAAIERREGGPADDLEHLVADLEPDAAARLVRAFLAYFRVVNLAEQVHRIRRRRDYLGRGEPQSGSLLAVFRDLSERGLDRDQALDTLRGLRFEPVFTAHPTEATRRSLLEKELEIVKVLVRRLDPSLTPPEERAALARVRTAVTAAWQTEEQPNVRPTVQDEMEHVLYHLTDVVYPVVPPFFEGLIETFEATWPREDEESEEGEETEETEEGDLDGRAIPERPSRDLLEAVDDLLRCTSWVGGDMDGNPYVSSETVRSTLREHRRQVLVRYAAEVAELARELSQSAARVDVDRTLLDATHSTAALLPEAFEQIPPRHRDMPYRVFLRLVHRRLELTGGPSHLGYADAEAFADDLRIVAHSLEANGGHWAGAFGVRRLLRRLDVFGFHLATLDLRQDALLLRGVVGRLLLDDRWGDRPSTGRTRRLVDLLPNAQPKSVDGAADPEAFRTLDVFRAVAEARADGLGDRAIGPFLISMTQGADDVLTILLLARWAGLVEHDERAVDSSRAETHVPLDVAPLFETVDDLRAAPEVLERLFGLEPYRHHLAARGMHQTVMIGYSDSNKDGGLAAARWALHQAQAEIVAVCKRHGVACTLFHGRGGTISRGGGKTRRAVLAAPRGTVDGRLRVTEQGEVIHEKYGLRGIALRTLERTVGAVFEATARDRHLVERPAVEPKEFKAESSDPETIELEATDIPAELHWSMAMEVVATESRTAYRALVWEDADFLQYFRRATPIDVIERMMIGSRPASRRGRGGVESLRAIPWVFAWTQSRHVLPGWYGLGTGLEAAIERLGRNRLVEMVDAWPFLRALFEDVEMVLAKADLEIASRYAALAGDAGARLFPRIRAEFERTRDTILDLTGHQQLLEGDPTLARSIRLRNPYIDPMSLLQVDLLDRWRTAGRPEDAVFDALLGTVHGIAQGLHNTG